MAYFPVSPSSAFPGVQQLFTTKGANIWREIFERCTDLLERLPEEPEEGGWCETAFDRGGSEKCGFDGLGDRSEKFDAIGISAQNRSK